MTDELSRNERIKEASDYLRGTLADGLREEITGAIIEDDAQLVKFHGMYLQDDRDLRPERIGVRGHAEAAAHGQDHWPHEPCVAFHRSLPCTCDVRFSSARIDCPEQSPSVANYSGRRAGRGGVKLF